MKTCPVCGEVVKRKVKGNCPHCSTKIELIKGKYIQANFIPPVKNLFKALEKQIKLSQDNIFPYRIPQHMILRTNGILEGLWMRTFPTLDDIGITSNMAIYLIEQSIAELLTTMSPEQRELGLVLWFLSGKDTSKFLRILTKHVKNKQYAMATQAEEDNWMTD